MAKIKLNIDKLNKAISSAFDEAVEYQSVLFDKSLTDDTWDWPRTTYRRSGDVVESPRDIVDTGELLDSKVLLRKANSAQFEWVAPHAVSVHDGATTASGLDLPARPWAEYAVKNSDVEQVMQRVLNKRLA